MSLCVPPPACTHENACKDQEIEQKFQDGMLTKMSKITDLISKLDGFAAGEDATRVKKCLGLNIESVLTSYGQY